MKSVQRRVRKAEQENDKTNVDVYQAFGRNTAAGRAIFQLYNKGAQNSRVRYRPNVSFNTKKIDPHKNHLEKKKQKFIDHQAKKNKYKSDVVPRPRRVAQPRRFPVGMRRKTRKQIDDEISQDMEYPDERRKGRGAVYVQSRQSQIESLQDTFALADKTQQHNAGNGNGNSNSNGNSVYGGGDGAYSEAYSDTSRSQKMPAPLPEKYRHKPLNTQRQPIRHAEPKKDPLTARFDEVLAEIDQRQAWMDEMRSYGQLTLQEEQQMKGECAQLLSELKKLDQDIKAHR